MNEIVFATIKNLVTEWETADAERVATRLGWGAERLAEWLELPIHGFELSDSDMPALRHLCANGINTKFSDIEA